MNRREFIQMGATVAGALAVGRVPAALGAEPKWVGVGSEADFALDQPVSVLDGDGFVVRQADGIRAFSSRCPHRGCNVSWQGTEFVCPCHEARFGLAGNVLKGPARENLPAIPVRIEEGRVLLQV